MLSEALCLVNDVSFRYGSRLDLALSGVSIQIPQQSILCLAGPSGSGKSTLLALLGGLLIPQSGTVEWYSGHDAAWIMQSANVLPRLTVLENVILGPICSGIEFDEAAERAILAIREVGLGNLEGVRATRLSGGQSQRVAVARALASGRPLIIADEPTAQLDQESANLVLDALRSACGRGGTVVMASHDPMIRSRVDQVVALRDGVIIS